VRHARPALTPDRPQYWGSLGGPRPPSGIRPAAPCSPAPLPARSEPLYANAHRSCWWELVALAAAAHPSVAAMARSLLAGSPVLFDGDPLRDLSLTAFLDKFVNKKPKASDRAGVRCRVRDMCRRVLPTARKQLPLRPAPRAVPVALPV
jgi:hypothetical protein